MATSVRSTFSTEPAVKMACFDLTDFDWSANQPLLPTKVRGKSRVDDPLPGRQVLAFAEKGWRRAGHWARILDAVSEAYDGDIQMIDPSSIRVHQPAANGQKKTRDPPSGKTLHGTVFLPLGPWVARAVG